MPQKNLKKKVVNTKTKATQSAKTLSKPKKTVSKVSSGAISAKRSSSKVVPVAKSTAVKRPSSVKTKTSSKKVVSVKSATPKALYKVGNYVVYPTHGVGKIMAEETQQIADVDLRMLVISFEKDKMTLRVPLSRASAAGLRPVSSAEQMKKVFVTLKSRARTSRGMWSRRAQEYETKINSGNIHSIAEVVRDLHQNVDQSERSYSERMIYESALSRLVGELAACEGTDYKTATDKLMKLLRAKVAAAAAAAEAEEVLKEAA